jgi:hypothetical protein
MTKDAGNSFSDARNFGNLNGIRNLKDSVNLTDKLDFYRFSLSGSSNFTTTLKRLKDNADLTLFDSDRRRIAISKNVGSADESISTVLEKGDYFIRIDQKGTTDNTNYRLRFSTTPFIRPEQAGNSRAEARAITVSSTPGLFQDSVGTADTNDFYSFSTTAFGNLSLNLSGLSADANIQLLNSNGAVIRSAIASGTAADTINTGLEAGTYSIRVFPGAGNTTTNYDLNVTLTPLKMVGLTDNNTLLTFDLSNSNNATSLAVTGVEGSLRGIDFRPADGRLYGVTTTTLYTIDSITGVATRAGASPSFGLSADVGADFNPTVDRLRVVAADDQNLRLNVDTGAIAGTDTALAYEATTDLNKGKNPNIVGSAYTNNFAGTTTTTLYGIDSDLDILVTQGGLNASPSPNTGQLFTIGALGFDFGAGTGFDIFTDANRTNTAFATSGSNLFSVNLTTGAATIAGTISIGATPISLIGLAIQG